MSGGIVCGERAGSGTVYRRLLYRTGRFSLLAGLLFGRNFGKAMLAGCRNSK